MGEYGIGKIGAERGLLARVPAAYILRPPYLYGPINNVYREAFVFDCAKADRKFYLPKDGEMKLQFFHVNDLCKLMEVIIDTKPSEHIMNVGNVQAISIKDWVTKCYACFDRVPLFVNVYEDIEQNLEEGLQESAEWYLTNETDVSKKPYFEYIDNNLI